MFPWGWGGVRISDLDSTQSSLKGDCELPGNAWQIDNRGELCVRPRTALLPHVLLFSVWMLESRSTTGLIKGVNNSVLTGGWPLNNGNLGGELFLILPARYGLRPANLFLLIFDRLTWASCSRSGVWGELIRLTALQMPTGVRKMASAPKIQAITRLGRLNRSFNIFSSIVTYHFHILVVPIRQ